MRRVDEKRRQPGRRGPRARSQPPAGKASTDLFRGGSVVLEPDAPVTVTVREVQGEAGLIPSAYPGLARDVAPGSRILLDDGNLELRVEAVEGTEILCTVVVGGAVGDRKGITLPGVQVSTPSLTARGD